MDKRNTVYSFFCLVSGFTYLRLSRNLQVKHLPPLFCGLDTLKEDGKRKYRQETTTTDIHYSYWMA